MIRSQERTEDVGLADAMLKLSDAVAKGKLWMDYREAAQFLGYSESQFKAMARTGEIPRHKLSQGGYRYHAGELTELLLSN